MRNVIDVTPEYVHDVGPAPGLGQQTSGGYTFYTDQGTKVSVELPGPGTSFEESVREWLGMDSLVAGVPNGWLVVAGVGLWWFGSQRRRR
jgi:hypothetical protein